MQTQDRQSICRKCGAVIRRELSAGEVPAYCEVCRARSTSRPRAVRVSEEDILRWLLDDAEDD